MNTTVHHLKCVEPHFSNVVQGNKFFEIRKDDRAYKVGDVMHLMCYDAENKAYNGDETYVYVTYIMTLEDIAPGYVLMSIRHMPVAYAFAALSPIK